MIKKVFSKKKQEEKLPTRITNDTVAEHRERVLAGGRKLKYPVQYARNTLVRNAILISLAGLVILAVLMWLQLYVWRSTNDFAYRVTQVLPVPVANIDGQSVPYSEYLMYHRSTISALESQGGSDGAANDRMKFQQQQALERALEDAYAKKLAKERNIAISREQVDELIAQHRENAGLTENAYSAVVSDRLAWTMDELHIAMHNTLLRQEVAFSVDDDAAKVAQRVGDLIEGGDSLSDAAEALGEAVEYQADIVVPKDNSDGGLSTAALGLDVGKTSGRIKTLAGDGYYFITRHASDDGAVSYSYIKVPLTTFRENFAKLKDSDSTKIYIDME